MWTNEAKNRGAGLLSKPATYTVRSDRGHPGRTEGTIVTRRDTDSDHPLFAPQDGVRTLRMLAYEQIRDAILDGSLAPGQRVKERDVAEQMRISTTPVKEALRQLETEGLIESEPRRGAVVSAVALTAVEEIILLRAAIEGLGARLSALKMDEAETDALGSILDEIARLGDPRPGNWEELSDANNRFHRAIVSGSHSYFLQRFAQSLAQFDRSATMPEIVGRDEAKLELDEHRAIYSAVSHREPDAAEQRMRNHVLRTMALAIEWARTRSGLGSPRTEGSTTRTGARNRAKTRRSTRGSTQ